MECATGLHERYHCANEQMLLCVTGGKRCAYGNLRRKRNNCLLASRPTNGRDICRVNLTSAAIRHPITTTAGRYAEFDVFVCANGRAVRLVSEVSFGAWVR